MRRAFAVALILALVQPAAAQAQARHHAGSDPRHPAAARESLSRAILRDASRLGAMAGTPMTAAPAIGDQARPAGPSDWARVRQLRTHTAIAVTLKGTPTRDGYFLSADDTGLMIADEAGQILSIARADIAEINTARRSLRERLQGNPTYLLGLLAGTFAGTYVGPKLQGECDSCLGSVLIGSIVGGIAGTLLWDRAFNRRSELVYRAP